MKNNKSIFAHLEFQTAPVFQLLLIILAIFFIGNLLNISHKISITLGFACFVFGVVLAILKHKTLTFYTLSICVSFLLFANSEETKINFPNKIIPHQKAIISGTVKKIIKSDENSMRILVKGWIDSKDLPRIYNDGIILNVYKRNDYLKEINLGDKILANGRIRVPSKKVFDTDFDEMRYIQGLDANWIGTASSNKIIVTQKANRFMQIRNSAYKNITNKVNQLFDTTTAMLVRAVLLGNRSNFDIEIKNSFSITGVAHILALSGLHIGIISGVLLLFISVFPINRWLKFILFTVLVLCFVFLTGMQDSAIRAGAMAILFMFAFTARQYETNSLNIISAVVVFAIIISPSMIYSLSFQMSSLAIFGIVFFNTVFRNFFLNFTKSKNEFTRDLIHIVSITFSTSIVVSPIVAYFFNVYSIVSPLVNIIIVPFFSIALVFSVITVIFSFIFFPVAEIFAGCVELIFKVCVNITMFISSFDFAAITNHQSLVLIAILSSISLIYILASREKQQFFFRLIICILFFPVIIFLSENQEQNQTQIFAKERYCLLSIPLNSNEKFVWIADRQPTYSEIKFFDRGLIDYFERNKNIKYVGISGNYGKEFVQKILLESDNSKHYQIRELSFAEQREIENRFLNGKYISQYQP